jgi:hypothetical protein
LHYLKDDGSSAYFDADPGEYDDVSSIDGSDIKHDQIFQVQRLD